MATAKQYELLFMLKAQVESTFASGFSTAKNYMGELQSKVKEYNQALRDISAYEKHKSALDTLNQKFQNEQKALEETKTKIAENGSATKELTSEKEKHEKELARLTIQIEKNAQKLQEDKEQLEKAGISTDNLTREQAELEQQLKETTAEMEGFKKFENTLNDVANAFGVMKIGADLVANAVVTIDSGILSCINSAAELQYTMSGVQAVSGATAEETQQLTSLAKEMGATTVYTASQCAEAMQTQALAGWSVQEMLAGLPAVVKLAAASGEDLAEMTGIVSDALNAFGLQGEAAVTKFADVLTKAATSSNTTVSLMGESLSYVESTAANLGYSIEDVSVALAQMANNALKGSVSGSALNTMLTRMSGANETAANEMDNLSLSMYNADGSAKDLMTFLTELRTAFQGFGDDAQAAQVAAYNLAGQRGMRGLLSIVNASDEEWQQLTQDIYDYEGAASSVSDIRLDNYTGQVYLLESAWDALKTTIGEAFLPTATDAASLLTRLADKANALVQEHQQMIVVLGGAATAFGLVAAGISTVATAAQIAKFMLQQMSIQLMPMVGVGVAIGGIAAVIGGFAGAVSVGVNSLEGVVGQVNEVRNSVDDLTETVNASNESWEQTTAEYEEQREKANALIDSLEKLQTQDQDNDLVQQEIAATVTQLNGLLPDLNLEYDSLSGTISSTTDEMREFANAASADEMNATVNQVAEQKAELAQMEAKLIEAQAAVEAAQNELNNGGHDVYHKMVNTIAYNRAVEAEKELQAVYDETAAKVVELEGKADEYTQQLLAQADAAGLTSEQTNQIVEAAQAYQDAWSEAYDVAYEKLSGQISLFKEADEVTRISTDQLNSNLDSQLEQWTTYQQNLQTILDSGIDVSSMWGQLTDGSSDAMGTVEELAEKIKSGNTEAVETITGKWNSLNETISSVSSTTADGTAEVQQRLQDVTDAINNAGPELHEKAVEVAKGVVSGLGIGLKDDGTISANAGKLASDMIKQINQAAGVNSPSKYTIETGENVDRGLINGMAAKEKAVADKAKEVAKAAVKAFSDNMKESTFKTYSKNAIQGAIDGINAKKPDLVAAARAAAVAASEAYREAQDINSPSKVFRYYGEMDMAGAAQGIKQGSEKTNAVFAQAAQENAIAYLQAKEAAAQTAQESIIAGNNLITMIDPRAVELLSSVQQEKSTQRVLPVIPEIKQFTNSTSSSENKSTVIQLEYKPVIHVQGNVSSETLNNIRQQLIEHDGELVETLDRYLDEREDAHRRRTY
ncbi:MAG: phage tail tape measure protein [Eubacteriales bacterium]|nr:phage tail tape measure protein [Eubacteriales bacterium]